MSTQPNPCTDFEDTDGTVDIGKEITTAIALVECIISEAEKLVGPGRFPTKLVAEFALHALQELDAHYSSYYDDPIPY